jgi:hypothetical protein
LGDSTKGPSLFAWSESAGKHFRRQRPGAGRAPNSRSRATAAFKNHLSYLPHSGSVFTRLTNELAGCSMSSGALRFGMDKPLPRELVEKLIAVRLDQAFPASGRLRQPRKNSGGSR